MIQLIGFGAAGAAILPNLGLTFGQTLSAVPPPLPITPTAPLWSFTLASGESFSVDPIFHNGTIIYCVENGNTATIKCLDSQKRDLRWTVPTTGVDFQFLIAEGDTAYVTTQDQGAGDDPVILAIDLNNGASRQLNLAPGNSVNCPPVVAGGTLIFTTENGSLNALDTSDLNNSVFPSRSIGATGNSVSKPLIANRTIFIKNGYTIQGV